MGERELVARSKCESGREREVGVEGERGGMSVSGEGAALRSARKWLPLLCPEISDRSEGKDSVTVFR